MRVCALTRNSLDKRGNYILNNGLSSLRRWGRLCPAFSGGGGDGSGGSAQTPLLVLTSLKQINNNVDGATCAGECVRCYRLKSRGDFLSFPFTSIRIFPFPFLFFFSAPGVRLHIDIFAVERISSLRAGGRAARGASGASERRRAGHGRLGTANAENSILSFRLFLMV